MKPRFFITLILSIIFTQLFSQDKGTGMTIDLEVLKKTPKKVELAYASYRGMPSSFSLEKYAPSVGDQGQYGTCVAFACAYGAATILFAQSHEMVDKSTVTKCVFSPTYLFQNISTSSNCNGSDPVKALLFMIDNGLPFMRTVPYACGKFWGNEADKEATNYKITDAHLLFGSPDNPSDDDFKIESTKKALLEKTPVIIGFELPKSFFQVRSDVWNPNPNEAMENWQHNRHAMTVVGYDDYKEGGAFRIMNSWSGSWGNNGFIWVKYKDYARYCLLALQPFGNPNMPLPDFIAEEAPTPAPRPKILPKRDDVADVEPQPKKNEPKPQPKKDEPKPQPKKDEPKPQPKPQPKPTPQYEPVYTLKGSVEFKTNNGDAMMANRISTRNLIVEDDVVKETKKEEKKPKKTEGEDLVAYRMDKSYPSGTKFRFFINISEQAYTYAFATDLTGKVNRILPYDDLISTHVGANSIVAFPSEKKVVKMDDNKGTDYMLILYSTEKLDSKAIADKMSEIQGGLSKKIKGALGNMLINKGDIKYSEKEVGFEFTSKKRGGVVPLMVEISHN